MSFKTEFSLEDRIKESSRILQKYPDKVPIICEKSREASIECPDIDKKKYLVPKELTLGQFIYVLRKRLKLGPEKAIFLFIGKSIAPSSHSVYQIYNFYKDTDGFLYISYTLENVFG